MYVKTFSIDLYLLKFTMLQSQSYSSKIYNNIFKYLYITHFYYHFLFIILQHVMIFYKKRGEPMNKKTFDKLLKD